MGRRIGLLLPGIPHLLRGNVAEGGFGLVLWLGLWTLVLFRGDRILQAPGGSLDDRVALVTFIGVMVGIWIWSFLEGRRQVTEASDTRTGSEGILGESWGAFRENRMALLAWFVVCLLYLAMLLAPFLAFQGAGGGGAQGVPDLGSRLLPPSMAHPFGTDNYSQDVLSQILYGARISLSIGLLAVAISVTLGTLLGAVAGYLGGWVDTVIMRLVDVVMAFPRLVLLIGIVALFEANLLVIIVALAFTQWPFTTRLVRGEILSLREREFAEAARALGFSRRRILFRHLMPNAVGPLIVVAALGVGNAIILEAGLSFLGLGVPAGIASWGALVDEGRVYVLREWWVSTFPGLAIVLAVLAFNLVGDGLRDALDPRREREARS
jgi:peptide/nickel transport system permease protein